MGRSWRTTRPDLRSWFSGAETRSGAPGALDASGWFSSAVDRDALRRLLEQVGSGTTSPDAALERLVTGPLGSDASGQVDLGFARVDAHRQLRTGDPEVVYGAGKTAEQTLAIVDALREVTEDRPVLVTRAPAATVEAVVARWPEATVVGRTLAVGPMP